MLDENMTLDEVRDFFGHDLFATQACGCQVMEAARGHAVCEFEIGPTHVNAQGNVMGGAIFTLADFAFAVAANLNHLPTVAQSAQITFLAPGRGSLLRAEAVCVRHGRTASFYRVDVTDENGGLVASVTTNGFSSEKKEKKEGT